MTFCKYHMRNAISPCIALASKYHQCMVHNYDSVAAEVCKLCHHKVCAKLVLWLDSHSLLNYCQEGLIAI
jgi:hypothetical protein